MVYADILIHMSDYAFRLNSQWCMQDITSVYSGNTWFASHLQGEKNPLLSSFEVSFRLGEACKQRSILSLANKLTFP